MYVLKITYLIDLVTCTLNAKPAVWKQIPKDGGRCGMYYVYGA